MKTKILGLLAVGLLTGPMLAQAVPVQWSVDYTNSTSFTLSGSFVYDADTNAFSAINVFMDDKLGAMQDRTFTLTAGSNTASRFNFWDSLAADRTGAQFLDFQIFAASLTNAGGVISLNSNAGNVFAYRCQNASCSSTLAYGVSGLATGSLVGTPRNVPEPGTLALLGLGLTGLALSRRRKAN